jgi:hypothetical protein
VVLLPGLLDVDGLLFGLGLLLRRGLLRRRDCRDADQYERRENEREESAHMASCAPPMYRLASDR